MKKIVILSLLIAAILCGCATQSHSEGTVVQIKATPEIKATPVAGASSSAVPTESAEAFALPDAIEKDGKILFPAGDVKNFRYSDYLSQDEPLNLTEEEVDELLHLLRTAEEKEKKPEKLHGAFTGTSLCFELYGEKNQQVRLDAVSDGRINVSLWDASAEERTNDQLYSADLLEWIQQKTGYRVLTAEELRRITRVHCTDAALDEETAEKLLSVIQSGEAVPSDGPHDLLHLEFATEDGKMISGGLDRECGLVIVENGAYGPIDEECLKRFWEEIKQQ